MPFDASTEKQGFRVLVADNTRIHTQLLADALRRDRSLEVIGAASHSRDLMEAVTTHKIQVVVLSSNLDEEPMRGLETLRELRTANPDLRAIVLLDSSKREIVVEAFRAGARGVFTRHDSLETLGKCVHHVHAGQIWANEQQMVFAIEALAASPMVRALGANGLSLLSKREMEVVQCLAEGLTNREIAARLALSQHTVKNYLFRVFDKLGVSSRLELLSLTLSQASHQGGTAAVRGNPGAAAGAPAPPTVEWLQKAAEQGELTAQVALAEMYAEGRGTAKDLFAAYTWYLVSERTASDTRDEISAAQQRIAQSLTPEQIVEAKRAAERLSKPQKASPPGTDLPHWLLTSPLR